MCVRGRLGMVVIRQCYCYDIDQKSDFGGGGGKYVSFALTFVYYLYNKIFV